MIYFLIFISAIFVNNIVLSQFLGICPFLGVSKKIEYRTIRGAKWAKYAVGGVLAPMEFFMPMSTMIDTGQDNQMILHGGNFIKNFMGIFVLIALVGKQTG